MDRNVFCVITMMMALSWTFIEDASAGDWPQILGPNRNGIAVDERLAEKWPASGPKKLWNKKIGAGVAGVAISGDVGVLFHRQNDNDILLAFNAETGDQIWESKFPTSYQSGILQDDGPRTVPTINDGAVYAYSAQGRLVCVDLKTGDKRWERKTHEEFGADAGYFGAGSSPIVEGQLVIVNVGGGRKQAGIVAFHADTGKPAWTAINDQASYSAPVALSIDGTRHLLCITRLNFVSVDPSTGKERFRTRFGQSGPTVNGATPVVSGKHVLLTASYGIGAQWLEIAAASVNVVWKDPILSSQYTTPILHDGAIYGIDGRQDGGPISLKCLNPAGPEEYWSESGIGYATLIGANDLLLLMQTDGTLKLIRMSTKKYEELASAKLLPGTTRALPALSRGRFYVRNESTLVCIELSAR